MMKKLLCCAQHNVASKGLLRRCNLEDTFDPFRLWLRSILIVIHAVGLMLPHLSLHGPLGEDLDGEYVAHDADDGDEAEEVSLHDDAEGGARLHPRVRTLLSGLVQV